MDKIRKIGILGGTFDPIHNGHLMLGLSAYEQYHLDEIWFLPCGQPPHKSDRKVTAKEYRSTMVEMAIKSIPYFKYSDLEINRQGNSYTSDTLTILCERYPDTIFYYIVGADSLDYMEDWHEAATIFKKAVILAAKRNTQTDSQFFHAMEFLKEKYEAQIFLLECPLYEISSHEIREKVQNGAPINQWVNPYVVNYIQEHGLYLSSNKIV